MASVFTRRAIAFVIGIAVGWFRVPLPKRISGNRATWNAWNGFTLQRPRSCQRYTIIADRVSVWGLG